MTSCFLIKKLNLLIEGGFVCRFGSEMVQNLKIKFNFHFPKKKIEAGSVNVP